MLAFLGQVAALREKLGPILIQLPPSLEFERDVAENFFQFCAAILPGRLCASLVTEAGSTMPLTIC